MFVFQAVDYLKELRQYRKDIYLSCELAMQQASIDLDFIRIPLAEFEACPSESIDYAVMEKTQRASVVTMDVGWSDVGSWQRASVFKSNT